jgi:aminocarboxymuconate-semialdehyde decarboxylase
MQTIDIHNHFFPESWPDLAVRFGTPDWPWIRHTGSGKAVIMVGDREFRNINSACWDPEIRLQEMDRDGVDLQVISATPVLFAYERPTAHALDCARLFNDAALELCSRGKGRLKSLCQVPLQDIDAACAELTRAMKDGHLGVQIGNHVGDKNLDDEGIITFLTHCAHEGAAVLVHPWDMMAPVRMPKYMMPWTVGMPAETQLSLVALILSGAFDRLPSNLRICFAHGGGSFVFLLGRMENAWHHHPVARGKSEFAPIHYLNRFLVDSAVFGQSALDFLVQTMGDDRVLLGSDYPFPLGEERVGKLIRTSRLRDESKAKLLGGNAARFLGLGLGLQVDQAVQPPSVSTRGDEAADLAPHERLTYSSYLKIPELLSLQHAQSSPRRHDELLFIIVHQTYELWFKELLHDLEAVVRCLQKVADKPSGHAEVYEAARLLRRCTEIMRVLVSQFTILETMLPNHFLAFRDKLEPASGFQSQQFREIEFLCGLKDDKMLRHHESVADEHNQLQRRLNQPSLREAFFAALRSLGKLPPQDSSTPEAEQFMQRATAIRNLYQDESRFRDWIDVCERLTEFDELVVSWRLRHIQMIERTIGMKMGTGGTAGASYLRLTLDKKFFPELWEARTMLRQTD